MKFKEIKTNSQEKEKCEKDFLFSIGIPYFGKFFQQFSKRLKVLIKNKFILDIDFYCTKLKSGPCFQLKCPIPMFLISNVMYEFTCSCVTSFAYIGMITGHLVVRVEKHFHLKTDLAIQKPHECLPIMQW